MMHQRRLQETSRAYKQLSQGRGLLQKDQGKRQSMWQPRVGERGGEEQPKKRSQPAVEQSKPTLPTCGLCPGALVTESQGFLKIMKTSPIRRPSPRNKPQANTGRERRSGLGLCGGGSAGGGTAEDVVLVRSRRVKSVPRAKTEEEELFGTDLEFEAKRKELE